jgi:hypothetical protein
MTTGKKAKDIFNMTAIRDLLDGLNRPIAFRRALVDLTGSVQAALMLSQAIYWQERVTREDGWWYKSIEEWQEETGLNRRRLETARKKNGKYLSSVLRDIPARLYWKVNREALRRDLVAMYPGNSPSTTPEQPPAQFGGKRESSQAETADQFGGNLDPGITENDSQPGGNEQTSPLVSGKPDDGFRTNINMYTEKTTLNGTGIKKEVVAEITSERREAEGEKEADAENESNHYRLHQLIQSCILVFPEEDPAAVETIIKAAAGTFTLAWIRDAINEAIRRNDRYLRAVMEILDAWKVQGHTVSTGKRTAGFARVTGSGSH